MLVRTIEEFDGLPEGSGIEVTSETDTEYTGTWSFRGATIEVTVPKSICKRPTSSIEYSPELIEKIVEKMPPESIVEDRSLTIEERIERLDAISGDYGVEIEFHFLPEYSTKMSLWMVDDFHGYHGNTFEDIVSQAEKDFIK